MQIHGELFPVLKTGFVKKDQKKRVVQRDLQMNAFLRADPWIAYDRGRRDTFSLLKKFGVFDLQATFIEHRGKRRPRYAADAADMPLNGLNKGDEYWKQTKYANHMRNVEILSCNSH